MLKALLHPFGIMLLLASLVLAGLVLSVLDGWSGQALWIVLLGLLAYAATVAVLYRTGQVLWEQPADPEELLSFVLSERPTDSGDPFVYHKTTRRDFYDGELARLRAETGCDEVVFRNERGELTEGSRTNLFLERDGRLLTPPVSCGLLDGTLRRDLIEDPGVRAEESILRPADLESADRIFLGNSVRGLGPARRIA